MPGRPAGRWASTPRPTTAGAASCCASGRRSSAPASGATRGCPTRSPRSSSSACSPSPWASRASVPRASPPSWPRSAGAGCASAPTGSGGCCATRPGDQGQAPGAGGGPCRAARARATRAAARAAPGGRPPGPAGAAGLLLHRPPGGHEGHGLAVHRHRRGLGARLGRAPRHAPQPLRALDLRACAQGRRGPRRARLALGGGHVRQRLRVPLGRVPLRDRRAPRAPPLHPRRPAPDERLRGAGPGDDPGGVLEAGLRALPDPEVHRTSGWTWSATCATTTASVPTPAAGPGDARQRPSSGVPRCGRARSDASPDLGGGTLKGASSRRAAASDGIGRRRLATRRYRPGQRGRLLDGRGADDDLVEGEVVFLPRRGLAQQTAAGRHRPERFRWRWPSWPSRTRPPRGWRCHRCPRGPAPLCQTPSQCNGTAGIWAPVPAGSRLIARSADRRRPRRRRCRTTCCSRSRRAGGGRLPSCPGSAPC